jgi:hypothetical protein
MGNPAYDARREAECAEAEARKSAALASNTALEAITDFFNGSATLDIRPPMANVGGMGAWSIRFVRDSTKS